MKVSIIIPVYNDCRIENCLKSLFNQKYPKRFYEIIVVDNNSKISIKKIIEKYPVLFLSEKKQGASCARNRGLQIATGEIVAFIDADCIADFEWLKNLIRQFTNIQVGGVGGRILKTNYSNWIQKAAIDKVDKQILPGRFDFYPLPFITTANAAYRRIILKKLNGFDEQFYAGEDVDLAWRVGKLGFKVVTDKDALVYHEARKNLVAYFRQYFAYAEGHTLLFKKYKKEINKHYYINWFPLRSFFFNLKKRHKFDQLMLDIIQLNALTIGYFCGSIKNKVIFL